jgi:zinc transporter 1
MPNANTITGAFFNGVFLLALALSIFLQSIERFVHLEEVEDPKLILIVGCIGLGLNIISIIVVHGMFFPSTGSRPGASPRP